MLPGLVKTFITKPGWSHKYVNLLTRLQYNHFTNPNNHKLNTTQVHSISSAANSICQAQHGFMSLQPYAFAEYYFCYFSRDFLVVEHILLHMNKTNLNKKANLYGPLTYIDLVRAKSKGPELSHHLNSYKMHQMCH